jgi:transcription initiation factor TFIIIB Brf1 subunit/transcription initiation factor TFIIB
LGSLDSFKTNEQTILKTIVVLLRNTTWRCGKLERSIVRHLRNRRQNFGKSGLSVREIMHHLDLNGEKKDECIDAIKRLEKRNIVRILPL